ncbi:MAG TPA: histidine phosphatase family protein, partial [Aliiroseovarius sp.]|nr:histidine phosphatase family protein [Aliiroseovarius sp.]
SDLSRAVATAYAIAMAGHTRLPHSAALREFDFGAWDGLGFDAVAARDPELARSFWEQPGDIAAPEGESWNDVAGRVSQWVDHQNRAAPRHVIAVAHFGVILTQLQRALGVAPVQVLAHRIEPLSLTRLDWDGQQWAAGQVNQIL